MSVIKVLIVDDHPVFRDGLRNVLAEVDDLIVVGEAQDGTEALDFARSLQPDVIIMDINIPVLNGMQATRQIKSDHPDINIIMLTAYDDDEQIFHAIRSGASAYYPKDIAPDRLVETIRQVSQGKYVVDAQLLDQEEIGEWLDEAFERFGGLMIDFDEKFKPLSPREMEILKLITRGLSNKEIAYTLGISHQTVKNHMTSILRKLDVEDRTQAAVFALRRGWVRLQIQHQNRLEPCIMAEEEKSLLEQLVEESRKEFEQVQLELREIDVLIKQSTNEMDRLGQRNAQITNKMRQIESTFDTAPREDIQEAYTGFQDAQKRLFMMRGQLEKLQSDQENLQRYSDQLRRLLEATEGTFTEQNVGPQGAGASQPAIVRVIEAQERERQLLVEMMHDGPAQQLTNLILQAEICERLFDQDPTRTREELTNLRQSVTTTFQEVRGIMFDLRPMMLDDLGLVPTVKKFTEGFQEKSGLPVNLTITGQERRLQSHTEATIFRVVQELVKNARDHAHCTSIEVSLDIDDVWVRAHVEDNGTGFDVDEVMQAVDQYKTIGLATLRERVEMLGGVLDIDSGIGRGTKVSLQIPAE